MAPLRSVAFLLAVAAAVLEATSAQSAAREDLTEVSRGFKGGHKGGHKGGYNGGYNSYYKSASGEIKDEMKSRQVLPRDQLAKQAMQRQTIAAKRVPASACSEWLGVTLNEISEAPNEVAVVNDGCCFPSGCARAPSAGCFAQDGQSCCVPDSERKETC